MASIVIMDQLLIQNSRTAAASLLPPITTLPPTMVLTQSAMSEIKKEADKNAEEAAN